MIPIRDANPTRRVPIVTLALIAANVAIFLLWQPTFGTAEEQRDFYFCNAEIPFEVTHQVNLAHGGEAARRALADEGLGGTGAQAFLQQICPDKSWLASILGGEGIVCRFQGKGTVWCQSHNAPSFGHTIGPLLKPA